MPTLQDFRLSERIARGRTGDVFHGVQNRGAGRTDALVAIKRLAPQLARDARIAERWIAAANRIAQLPHPGICRVLCADTRDGEAYCVMELCTGLDLGRICASLRDRDEAMPVDCAALIVSTVAAALEAAHSLRGPRFAGVFHGDLTLSDVMVAYDGRVQVLNLGLSAALRPALASAERDESTPAGNARADIEALGRCLLQLLASVERNDPDASGAAPIDAEGEASSVTALRAIAARAVETRAGARFTSVAAVRKALESFLAVRGITIAAQSLRHWMSSTFASELRTSQEQHARIRAERTAEVEAEAVLGRGARATSGPLRRPRTDPGDAALDAALQPRSSDSAPRSLVVTRPPPPLPKAPKLPSPEFPSQSKRSDPDLTPPRGMLAERLAAEMTSSGVAPKPQPPPLSLHVEEATAVWVPSPKPSIAPAPVEPPSIAPAASPSRASSTPMWIGGTAFLIATGLLFVRQYVSEPQRAEPGTTSARPSHSAGVNPASAASHPGSAIAGSAQGGPSSPDSPIVTPRTAATAALEAEAPDLEPGETSELAMSPQREATLRNRRDSIAARRAGVRRTGNRGDRSAAPSAAGQDEPSDSDAESPELGSASLAERGPAAASVTTPPNATKPALDAVNRGAGVVAPGVPSAAAVSASAPSVVPVRQVREAVATSQEVPLFPARARRHGVHSGNVVLSFTVDRSGNVRNPVVVQSSPSGIFDDAAINAVLKWRYQPRLENGVAVESPNMRARVRFAEDSP